MNPLVSIITTVFNRSDFLAECIESVQQSRYSNYEHIIIDDCSTDKSVSIAQRYAIHDEKIKVVINDANLGDYPNRNAGAEHATGKYLKYLDADDLIGPWTIDIMVDSMEQFPDAGVGLMVFGDGSRAFPKRLEPREAYIAHYEKDEGIFLRSPGGAIIKRTVFNELGGFPEQQHVGDFEFWHSIAAHAPVVVLPTLFGISRIHEAQQSKANREDPLVPFKYFNAAIRGLTRYSPNKLNEYEFNAVCLAIRRNEARSILRHIKNCRFTTAYKLKLHSNLSWVQIIRRSFTVPKTISN